MGNKERTEIKSKIRKKNHKLTEWHRFCEWVESLPYAAELIIN